MTALCYDKDDMKQKVSMYTILIKMLPLPRLVRLDIL